MFKHLQHDQSHYLVDELGSLSQSGSKACRKMSPSTTLSMSGHIVLTEVSYTGSDIITLVVGQDENKLTYRVHKALLTAKSGFFRACLENQCTESDSKVIELKDDIPFAVEAFLGWLYSGKVDDKAIKGTQFLECYIFAERIMCNEYHNLVMDKTREHYEHTWVYISSTKIQKLYRRDLSHTPLVSFATHCMTYAMVKTPHRFVDSDNAKTHLENWLADHEMCKDLMRELMRYHVAPYGDPKSLKGCHWHQHGNDETCKPGKNT